MPTQRIKNNFKFPTVIMLLILEQWCNAHGANQSDVRRVSNFVMDIRQEASLCGQD